MPAKKPDEATFTFSTAMKWASGVLGSLAVAALVFMGGWIWNQQDAVTKLQGNLSTIADAVKTNATSVERLQSSDNAQVATLATIQVQMSNLQTNMSAANITMSGRIERIESTLGTRIDNIEKEARWRDRFPQPAGRGR